jgi:hypothetical protein
VYREEEKLILVADIGSEDLGNLIKEGTEVTFIKAIDDPSDLSKSKVYIRHGKKGYVVPEIAVRPLDENKPLNALAEFNKAFMQRNPELKIYHPNVFLRYFYRFIFWVKGLFKKEENE